MSAASTGDDRTVLESLAGAIREASAYDKNDQVAPAAVLWTDEERAWTELLPRLRAAMPELITLGTYDPATKTGPAIWIKAMLGHGEDARPLLPLAN